MKSFVNSECRLILHMCVYSMKIFLINPTRLLNVYSFKNLSHGRLSAKVVWWTMGTHKHQNEITPA